MSWKKESRKEKEKGKNLAAQLTLLGPAAAQAP